MKTKINWSVIQTEYDKDMSQRDIIKKYKMSSKTITMAVRRGDLISRSKSDASKLGCIKHPRTHTIESKAKLSKIAKANGFGGHTSKHRLYFKKKDGSEVYLHSSYEILLASIFEELNVIWDRPKPFIWIDDNGIDHRYYPDFKVGEKYFDTKNDYLAKIDARKIELVKEQNNIDLSILLLPQITKEHIALLV